MDNLRRVRFEPARLLPRRVPRSKGARNYPRLRVSDRAMAESLDQLRLGVPLNWSQIEDDAELVTMASLYAGAQERREQTPGYVPALFKVEIYEKLVARLPEYKPEPVKERPKSLAGFSENVPVLTQAEEDVPELTSNLLPWIGATLASTVALILLVMAVSSAAGTLFKHEMSYTWLEVHKDGETIARRSLPSQWSMPACANYTLDDPAAPRTFLPLFDRNQIELSAGFPVQFLPAGLSVPTTYTLTFTGGAIAPCVDTVPDPSDPGAVVKLSYSARRQLANGYATISPLTVFQAKQLPTRVDVTAGEWREVQVGNARGVYWRGAPYRDIEGTTWIGDVSVMVVEDGDMVTTFIGQPGQGVNEEMLTALIEQSSAAWYARQTEVSRPLPQFNWIEVRRGEEVLSQAGSSSTTCSTRDQVFGRWTFQYVGSLGEAQQYAGFPLVAMPQAVNVPMMIVSSNTPATPVSTVTVPSTITLVLADFAVNPCNGQTLVAADPGATVKLRYSARRRLQGSPAAGRLSDVIMFQSKGQTTAIDIGPGIWKEVQLGDVHGLVLFGGSFRDPEGIQWTDAAVMVLEKGDTVVTMVGNSLIGSATLPSSPGFSQGMAEDILVEIARNLGFQ